MAEQRVLLKDRNWHVLNGDACRIVDFTPMAGMRNGEVHAFNKATPYAAVTFECAKIPGRVKGFIYHRLDFLNLTEAMEEMSRREDTEVLMFWSKAHLSGYARLFSKFMPRFYIMLCPKGAFEIITDNAHKPELSGQARFFAKRPILKWTPEVMK